MSGSEILKLKMFRLVPRGRITAPASANEIRRGKSMDLLIWLVWMSEIIIDVDNNFINGAAEEDTLEKNVQITSAKEQNRFPQSKFKKMCQPTPSMRKIDFT